MKKLIAVLLAVVLCMSLTVTAAAQSADPVEALPGSVYYYGYAVEGMDDLIQFYHFYPDDLGIGAVFYAGYAWNQITFSGTYTVEKADCEYEVLFEKDGEAQKGTAPYTITLYGWDGAELDKIGYDGEYVYNCAVNVNCDPMTGGGTYRQAKADAAALEAGKATFDGEKGVAYMNFIAPEDESCTLQLNTNGTYEDLVLFFVEGTWAKTSDNEYTLTPSAETDEGAVVTAQEDGSWKYVSTSGEEMVLNQVKDAAVAYTFTGKFPFMDAEADATILAMDDGTCTVSIAAFGTEMPIDNGTWTEENFTFTFNFEGAGECVSEFGGDTGVQVTYTNPAVDAIGGAELTVTCGVVIG